MNIKIYATTILRVVLYGYETWSLTLREEYRLRFSDNVVLREILGPKTVEVAGDWKRLHNEGPAQSLLLTDTFGVIKLRRMRWAEYVTSVWEKRGAYRVLLGET